MSDKPKPKALRVKHLTYLDDLRESGVTNMFGARSWLIRAFPALSDDDAAKVLSYWMATFSERKKAKDAKP